MTDNERNELYCRAANLTSHAEIARSTGDFEGAIRDLREALRLKRQALGALDPSIELTLDNLDAMWQLMQEMAAWRNKTGGRVVPIMTFHE